MADHPKVCRARFVNQPKRAHSEMAPINTLSFFNGKWPIHAAGGDFFINKIHNVLRSNIGRREIIRNESKIERGQIAYRGTK